MNGDSVSAAMRGGSGTALYYEELADDSLSTGVDYHVMIWLSQVANGGAGAIRIFVNGVEDTTTTVTSTKTTTANFVAATLFIAARNNSSLYLDGRIDDVRIYTGDKTADVAAIYADKQ
jgi:hypothetical protein